mmetsp:Transcript_122639/g.392591  ORF Transcript_122639/g.392591 Transcript_122639/m.392591 type:complete len:207 (-) Transcript_122639:1466-2086(-)
MACARSVASSFNLVSNSLQMPTRIATTRSTLPRPLLAGKLRPSCSAFPPRSSGWLAATLGSNSAIPSAARNASPQPSDGWMPSCRTLAAAPVVASAAATNATTSSGSSCNWPCAIRRADKLTRSLHKVCLMSSPRSTHEPQSNMDNRMGHSAPSSFIGGALPPPPRVTRLSSPRRGAGGGGSAELSLAGDMASSRPGTQSTLKFPG